MENRGLNALRDVRGIKPGSAFSRRCGEPNLVVYNDVDNPAFELRDKTHLWCTRSNPAFKYFRKRFPARRKPRPRELAPRRPWPSCGPSADPESRGLFLEQLG